MTPKQIQRAKSIIEHAAVESIETEEIVLLGWAIQAIAARDAEIADLKRGGVVVPERAAWLTVDEMANALVLEFGAPLAAARGFAKAIADASIAKGSRAIHSDRMLGDGMVAVDRRIIEKFTSGCHEYMPGLGRCGDQYPGGERQLCSKCAPLRDALRANQGGAAT